jgi:hypothetical protein
MIPFLKSFFSHYRLKQAQRLREEHAAMVAKVFAGGRGSLVAQHKASVLVHERLRRGV